jgi:hypothetical protein
MIPHSERPSTFNFAIAARQALVKYSRRSGSLVLETLQHAYDTHVERAEMRLAPAKPRSWRDIPRAGAHHDYY